MPHNESSRPALTTLLHDLVAIDSINPDLVPGAAGEAEVARYIADWLQKVGCEVHLQEVRPGRPNVIALVRGTGGGKTLLLNGHIDTVGVAGMTPEACQPSIDQGRLYGRGAYDMKAGVAACMLAMAEAAKHPRRGTVIFSAVMDEEYAGLGTQALVQEYRADGAIIAEPTELQLILAHKGFVWLEVETIGVAAHGSRPDLGIDAIAKMGGVLTGLEQLQRQLQQQPPHPYLKTGSIHASLIQGGQDMASYPDRCVLSIERRTIPGESADMVESQVQTIIQRLSETDQDFKAVVRRGLVRTPLETPPDSDIVRLTNSAANAVLGRPVELAGAAYWTDAATLWAAGIPSLLFGPVGAGAHAMEEWVDLESVQTCYRVYAEVISTFCA
jgi:acetylornithine deacetylase